MDLRLSKSDPNSFSNPEQCLVKDIHLNLSTDFTKKILSGYVDISFERIDPKASTLVLDSRYLSIHNVRNRNTMKKMPFNVESYVEPFGSKLEVKLPKSTTKKYVIRIDYETSPKANGLQWLDPQQTCGKKHPYLFSHCEAVHARSVLPCQDTPFVKATYSASITVPSDLTVLMSAIREGDVEEGSEPNTKIFKFLQAVPIPSYLIAIAVGELESRKIGPRSHVWSEKDIVEKAAKEFTETEAFLKVAEDMLGPYIWGIYDLLVLPPSFPFGGMENPCLTFVTPSLLAGDGSLQDVVAHEIAHSWTGNLVTNSNFEHFWLNEGFTVFCERKILGRLHGEAFRQFHAIGGWKELEYTIDTELGADNAFTKLVCDLSNRDPDDAFSTVPYEKGHTFLFYLEQQLGGPEIFESFLRAYVEKFKKQSIDTDTWKAFLYEYFHDKKDILDKVDWKTWLYATGMPPVKPNYDMSLSDACIKLCETWVTASDEDLLNFKSDPIKDFTTAQIIEFLSLLLTKEPLSEKKLKTLEELYGFGKTKNSEIRFRWLRLGLIAHWKPITDNAIEFLNSTGRMKFVRPIYRDLYDWEETRALAVSNYKKHFDEMMYVTAYTVSKDLHIEPSDMVST